MKRIAMIGLLLTGSIAAPAQSGVIGHWATGDGSVVQVVPCGSEVCLTVAKVRPGAPTTTDTQNPDAALRSRPLCGLRIGEGFKTDGPEAASGGKLYDPKGGKTYSGKLWLKDGDLHLRGYIGFSAFGRSEVWKRTVDPGPCH